MSLTEALLASDYRDVTAPTKGCCCCGFRYGLDSYYLDILFLLGLRSDCGQVGDITRVLLVIATVTMGALNVYWKTYVVAVKHVFGLGILSLGRSVTVERMVAHYWKQASNNFASVVWAVYLSHFVWTVCFPILHVIGFYRYFLGEEANHYTGGNGPEDTMLLIYDIANSFSFVAIVSICTYIQQTLITPMQDSSVSVNRIYDECSDVKVSVREISVSMEYWLFFQVSKSFFGSFVGLAGLLQFEGGHVDNDIPMLDYTGTDIVHLSLYGTLLIFNIGMLSYPSILVGRACHRFHTIIAHTGCFRGGKRDASIAKILTCLYLSADNTAISLLGFMITKETTTLIVRICYVLVAYMLAKVAAT